MTPLPRQGVLAIAQEITVKGMRGFAIPNAYSDDAIHSMGWDVMGLENAFVMPIYGDDIERAREKLYESFSLAHQKGKIRNEVIDKILSV
jgi:hypothetical protein